MTTRNREQPPFGRRLQTLRERAGLTQPQLAGRAELSAGLVSSVEQGARPNPTLETVRRLAEALSVTVADLVGEE